MNLILPIGYMCLAILMLVFMALLLATKGGMAEFLQWLAQSGPMDWFFMAIGAVVIWGAIGYSPVLPPSQGLDGVLETTSGIVTPTRAIRPS